MVESIWMDWSNLAGGRRSGGGKGDNKEGQRKEEEEKEKEEEEKGRTKGEKNKRGMDGNQLHLIP